MRRSVLRIMLLGVLVLLLGACESADNSPSDGDTPPDGDSEPDGDTPVDGDEPDGDGDVVDGDGPDGDMADGDEPDGDDPPPIIPHAACGMPPYDVLPRQDVGHLISYEENTLFSMTPRALDALLSAAGYTALSPVPYGSRVFRFRYTTQDRGQPVEATAFLSIPAHAELPEAPMPLVLFGHGTTGFADSCAPTASEFEGPALPALVASQGFVGVSPDYIGMAGFGEGSETTHAYLVGEQLAFGCWDALRAGLELIELHLSDVIRTTPEKTVIWGASQGGHMALYTELYGPYYAPEFNVKAVVAGIAPSVLKPLAEFGMQVKSPPTVGLIPMFVTMRRWYSAPDALSDLFTNVEPHFLADNIESIVFPEENCKPDIKIEWDDVEIEDVFQASLVEKIAAARWDELENWSCYLDENSLATSSVTPLRYTPTLMVYAENDDLVLTPPMREDFDRLCALGYQLDYLECANAGHSAGAVWSLPEQVRWIYARLADEPLNEATHCQRQAPVCCSGSPENACTPETESR